MNKQFETKWVIDWTGNNVIDALESLTNESGLLHEKALADGGFQIQPHASDENLYRVTVHLNMAGKGMTSAVAEVATTYFRLSNFTEETEFEVRKSGTEKWKIHVLDVN